MAKIIGKAKARTKVTKSAHRRAHAKTHARVSQKYFSQADWQALWPTFSPLDDANIIQALASPGGPLGQVTSDDLDGNEVARKIAQGMSAAIVSATDKGATPTDVAAAIVAVLYVNGGTAVAYSGSTTTGDADDGLLDFPGYDAGDDASIFDSAVPTVNDGGMTLADADNDDTDASLADMLAQLGLDPQSIADAGDFEGDCCEDSPYADEDATVSRYAGL